MAPEELNFEFYLILINLNSCLWLVATILKNLALDSVMPGYKVTDALQACK